MARLTLMACHTIGMELRNDEDNPKCSNDLHVHRKLSKVWKRRHSALLLAQIQQCVRKHEGELCSLWQHVKAFMDDIAVSLPSSKHPNDIVGVDSKAEVER